jgi:predicted transcriptional regulator
MSADDKPNGEGDAIDSEGAGADADQSDVRERLEQEAGRAREQFDDGLIDLLSWILDTETRARIYVYLCQEPDSTSDEVAEGTGLYPSTVREALAELHEEGQVTRIKRESGGAGNNPYEYSALPPSELVAEMVGDVQKQLNTVFNLDEYLDGRHEDGGDEPVTITVRDEHDDSVAAGMGENGDDSSDPDAGDTGGTGAHDTDDR